MKRATIGLIVLLSAAGLSAQQPTTQPDTGTLFLQDPNQFFGMTVPLVTYSSADATYLSKFRVNTTGDVIDTEFKAIPNIIDIDTPQVEFTFGVVGLPALHTGSYTVDGKTNIVVLTGNGIECVPDSGSVSLGVLNKGTIPDGSSGTPAVFQASFQLDCTATQKVSGSFTFTQGATTGGGGGGGGGGNFPPGGVGSGGIQPIPGLGSRVGTPSAPTSPVIPVPTISIAVDVPTIDLEKPTPVIPGETAVVRLETISSNFASPITFTGSGPAGLTFSFSPASVLAPGFGSTTLTLGATDAVQIGESRVTVTASGGGVRASTSFPITIFCDVPMILGISQPRSTSIASGSVATMEVKPQGSGTLRYQWYEGHKGSLLFPVAGANSSTLTTAPLSQSTEYWVRVTNGCGTADSENAQVTVRR